MPPKMATTLPLRSNYTAQVIAWGSCESGAGMNIIVTGQLRSGVKSLAATGRAFAAVKVPERADFLFLFLITRTIVWFSFS